MAHVFIPTEMLENLAAARRVDFNGEELFVLPSRHRFQCADAIRILSEVASGADPLGLCGTVRTREAIEAMGGEILGDSLLVEDAAYDVAPGVLCSVMGEPASSSVSEEAAIASLAD